MNEQNGEGSLRAEMDFEGVDELGFVVRVDTSHVLVHATNSDLVTTVQVGGLVALAGANSFEYLIGMVEGVVRESTPAVVSDEEADPESESDREFFSFTDDGNLHRDAVRVILIGTYRVVDGLRRNVFKRGADSFPRISALCWLVDGENLRSLTINLVAEVPEHNRLTIGRFANSPQIPVSVDGDRFFQRHAAIVGSTGTGKSWTVALILERASQLQYPNMVVFDLHGEYSSLLNTPLNITGYEISGSQFQELESESLRLPYWMLNTEEMLSLLLDRADANAPNQASRLTIHITALRNEYIRDHGLQNEGIVPSTDTAIPYKIDQLIQLLEDDDQERINNGSKQGPYFGRFTRLVSRIRSRTADSRFGFMFDLNEKHLDLAYVYELAQLLLVADGKKPGIKVIDVSKVPSDLIPLITSLIARTIFSIQLWTPKHDRNPVALICDEAHLYIPASNIEDQQNATEVFERIAKEGRKYGVALLVVSQRPAELDETVLSQVHNFVSLRLSNEADRNAVTRLLPESQRTLIGSLPLLDIGEALLVGDCLAMPSRIKLDGPAFPPASATLPYWNNWMNEPSRAEVVDFAVRSMIAQKRIDCGSVS